MNRRVVATRRRTLLGVGIASLSALALAYLLLGVVLPPEAHVVDGDAIAPVASAGWLLRLGLATAAACCFLLTPGMVLRRWTGSAPLLGSTALLWLPGFLYLVAVGAAAWALASVVDPGVLVTVCLVPIPIATLWSLVRFGPDMHVRTDELLVLLMLLMLLAIGIGRATWSPGPTAELYGGTVSRTLESSLRSDSRISYHVGQLVAHGESPYGGVGGYYYAPYSFYARGPIAGLAAAAVVLGGNASPPVEYPSSPWEPYDAAGFASYRIALMLMNATIVLSVYGVLRRFLRPALAHAGTVLVAGTPFVIREIYFTWPKLLAASFALTAFLALTHRRRCAAGFLLGLGYLAHPSVAFAMLAVVLAWAWILARGGPDGTTSVPPGNGRTWVTTWIRDVLLTGLGFLVVFGAWQIVNRGHAQDYFSDYLYWADGRPSVPFTTWTESRLSSLANTLIPLRAHLTDATVESAVSARYLSPLPDVVRFSFAYTNTLPFAVGVLYFPAFVYGLVRFARRAFLLFLGVFAAPLLAFVVYWGSTIAGVLREGLHFFVVTCVLAAFIGHTAMWPGRTPARIVRALAAIRAIDVFFMVLVPTIWTTGLLGRGVFRLTDLCALALMVGGIVGLGWVTWQRFDPDAILASPRSDELPHFERCSMRRPRESESSRSSQVRSTP